MYSNECFPEPVVLALRALGHDILTTHQAGKSGLSIPDDEVVRFAREDGRVLLSLNRIHFRRLHRANAIHAGIILCFEDRDFERQAADIHAVLEGNRDMAGRLILVRKQDR